MTSPRVARWALAVCAVVVGTLTLGPLPMGLLHALTDGVASVLGVPARPLDQSVEKLSNIVMFAPATALLGLALPRTPLWMVLASAVLASAALEIVQLAVLSGRHPSGLDVLLNTTGALLGVGAVHILRKRGLTRAVADSGVSAQSD